MPTALTARKLCSIHNVWRSENSFTTQEHHGTTEKPPHCKPSYTLYTTFTPKEDQMVDASLFPRQLFKHYAPKEGGHGGLLHCKIVERQYALNA